MMKTRQSPRRSKYDYGSPWGYFITICTKNREHFFGDIIDGTMILSQIGIICEQEIKQTNHRRNYIEIDEYVVMPNHIHLLLFINSIPAVGTCGNTSLLWNKSYVSDALPCVPTTNHVPTEKQPKQTLWSIIRNIKSRVTKYAHEHDIRFWWQGRYHDRIIRDQQSYEQIKYYIETNPQNRESDTFNQ